ncbi:MAG: hypothetical protein WCZ24_03265 [Bacilli bacterium]
MNIYRLLELKQRRRSRFSQKEEHSFFMRNREILTKFPRFATLYDVPISDFDVMRANIIITGYLNKVKIEEEIANISSYLEKDSKADHVKFLITLKERTIDLPYYTLNKNKIYIPFFSLALNSIYTKEPEKILTYPYDQLKDIYGDSAIDPFDTYGPNLYDSLFTRLVKLGTNGKEIAFFHYDMNVIYIVGSQGRLVEKIVLFDRYIKQPDYAHMLERLKPVIEAYFADSREDFINALYKSNFISDRIYWTIKGPLK